MMELCETAMYGFGMQWDSLRILDAAVITSPAGEAFVNRASHIVGHAVAASPEGLWGCKNPRVARLARLWVAAFARAGCNDRYVVTLRNPLSVANSVILGSPHRAVGVNPTHLHLMWLVHTVGALRPAMMGKPSVVVEFDRVMANPVGELERIAARLSLPVTPHARVAMEAYGRDFLKPGLRHSAFGPEELAANPLVPPVVARAFAFLTRVAQDSPAADSEEFRRDWGAIEDEVDALRPVFEYIDSMDHKLMRRQAVARRIYRRLPIKVKRLLARLA